jgi:hypothetical protein
MSEGPTFEEPQPQLTCLAEDDVVARVHEAKAGSGSRHIVKRAVRHLRVVLQSVISARQLASRAGIPCKTFHGGRGLLRLHTEGCTWPASPSRKPQGSWTS